MVWTAAPAAPYETRRRPYDWGHGVSVVFEAMDAAQQQKADREYARLEKQARMEQLQHQGELLEAAAGDPRRAELLARMELQGGNMESYDFLTSHADDLRTRAADAFEREMTQRGVVTDEDAEYRLWQRFLHDRAMDLRPKPPKVIQWDDVYNPDTGQPEVAYRLEGDPGTAHFTGDRPYHRPFGFGDPLASAPMTIQQARDRARDPIRMGELTRDRRDEVRLRLDQADTPEDRAMLRNLRESEASAVATARGLLTGLRGRPAPTAGRYYELQPGEQVAYSSALAGLSAWDPLRRQLREAFGPPPTTGPPAPENDPTVGAANRLQGGRGGRGRLIDDTRQ